MAFPQNTLYLVVVAFHVLLSLLFSAFAMHGNLPSMFMKTAIVPIIKNTTLEIPAIKTIRGILR